MKDTCVGCGATIQTIDPKKPGYIEEKIYLQHQERFYCQRCFTLQHYNRNIEYDISSEQYLQSIEQIKQNPGLIVNVIDLFDLEGTIIPNINSLLNSDNILLALNKVDLYLNSININKIIAYVQKFIKEKKIKIKEMIVMSSFNNNDIITLIDKIQELRNHQNVYFVGMTNVGKSSIINQIIKYYTKQENLITVSNTINTTLDNIYIPLDNTSYLVDTPGISNKNNLMYFIDKATLEMITPKSYIRPKTFQLNPLQTLFIMGFVRLDFVEGKRSSFITNFKNDILIHRTKLENAEEFYNEHKDDILKIPTEEERKRLGGIKQFQVKFNESEKMDLSINGLGFISIHGEGIVMITTFKNIQINRRKAFI